MVTMSIVIWFIIQFVILSISTNMLKRGLSLMFDHTLQAVFTVIVALGGYVLVIDSILNILGGL